MPTLQVLIAPAEHRSRRLRSKRNRVVILTYKRTKELVHHLLLDAQPLSGGRRRALGQLRLLPGRRAHSDDLLRYARMALKHGREKSPFLSLGADIVFYRALLRYVPYEDEREQILAQLHDVPYLEEMHPDHPSLTLRNRKDFRIALLPDPASVEAYGDAKEVLLSDALNPNRFNFRLRFKLPTFSMPHDVSFRFDPEIQWPTRVTVLIGKNGTGKTQTLVNLVNALLIQHRGRTNADSLAINRVRLTPEVTHRWVNRDAE